MANTWLHTMDEAFETPLSRAERTDHSVLSELMIQYEQSDRDLSVIESSLLHRAAAMGLGHVADALLREGAEIDLCDIHGETPLHKAVRNGHADVVEKLVEAGANTNASSHQGLAPLHWAALVGDATITDMLLNAGADPALPAVHLDNLTPLDLARIMDYAPVERRLTGLAVA